MRYTLLTIFSLIIAALTAITEFDLNFQIVGFPPEISEGDIPPAEVASYLNSENRTHIAWNEQDDGGERVMYSVYANDGELQTCRDV